MVQTLVQSSIDLPLHMIVIAIVSNDLTESNVTLALVLELIKAARVCDMRLGTHAKMNMK